MKRLNLLLVYSSNSNFNRAIFIPSSKSSIFFLNFFLNIYNRNFKGRTTEDSNSRPFGPYVNLKPLPLGQHTHTNPPILYYFKVLTMHHYLKRGQILYLLYIEQKYYWKSFSFFNIFSRINSSMNRKWNYKILLHG